MKQFDKQIEKYKELVWRYHKTLDLMSPKGLNSLDDKIEDARMYSSQIKSLKTDNKNIVDIGSGAGLPGVILAIELPSWNISLVDRRQRRISFLTIVKSQLGLDNANIFNTDVSSLSLPAQSVISAQAVADFKTLYCISGHLHSENISLISRKGVDYKREISTLEASINSSVFVYAPKKLSSEGNLVTISLVGGKKCRQLEL